MTGVFSYNDVEFAFSILRLLKFKICSEFIAENS